MYARLTRSKSTPAAGRSILRAPCKGVRMMRVLASLLIIYLLTGCASKVRIMESFVEDSRLEKIVPDWTEGVWEFEIRHNHDEFNYSFSGIFTSNKYRSNTCLSLPRDGTWLVLEIPILKTAERTQKDVAAFYTVDGGYLEIYMPSNLCDHSFEKLRSKVLREKIIGFQTYDHFFTSSTTVTGELVAKKSKTP